MRACYVHARSCVLLTRCVNLLCLCVVVSLMDCVMLVARALVCFVGHSISAELEACFFGFMIAVGLSSAC